MQRDRDKKSRRLLFVNPHQFGYTAGYYYYCYYLREFYEIDYICFDKGLPKMEMDDVNIIYVSKNGNKLLVLLKYLYKAIQQSNKDDYNIMYVYSFYFSFVISSFSRVKHKVLDVRTGSISKSKIKRYLENLLIRFNIIFFKKVIVLSGSLINLFKISNKKGHLLPLGSKVYFEGNHEFNDLRLLYVGALNTRNVVKTIQGVYLFFANLSKNDPRLNISYQIIGFGNVNEENEIKNTICDYKLENSVTFLGRKNYEELAEYFKNCNIGISWIPITPAFDLQPATKTYEYILSGLFCIATATTANRELINDDNGILCGDTPDEFANALQRVWDLKNSFGSEKIRETLSEFTWNRLVHDNLLPFLEKLINKSF